MGVDSSWVQLPLKWFRKFSVNYLLTFFPKLWTRVPRTAVWNADGLTPICAHRSLTAGWRSLKADLPTRWPLRILKLASVFLYMQSIFPESRTAKREKRRRSEATPICGSGVLEAKTSNVADGLVSISSAFDFYKIIWYNYKKDLLRGRLRIVIGRQF